MPRWPCLLLLLAGLGTGCSGDPSPATPSFDAAPAAFAGPSGRVRGVVRLQGEPPAPEFDPIEENQHICGHMALLPRMRLGADNAIRDAFVYLEGEGLDPVRSTAPPADPVLVDQRECEYAPHALVVRSGTRLEVTNSDSILHNVHGREPTSAGMRTLFNIAQPVQGQRTRVNSPLTDPGIVHLSCEAGHPWMSAHVLVSDHPYAAVTGEDGAFLFDDVPVGTHRITLWHEGVRVKRIVRSLDRYEYEEPYEITREVTVEAGMETVVHFDMELRPEG